ncbi:hypothetical protein J6T21_03610 [Candidatus Saccharibacteria bacterium]|nr:hypothetical protein [Candidatus Saccharibacteria bacterium]
MKRYIKNRFGSFWLIIFLILAFSFAISISDDTYARCVDGYCYDVGTNASGGTCADSSKTTTHWDTCFGLSWVYYKWPKNWDKDIVMYGSEHAGGNATVDKKCKQYGGFWFLGYEAYLPSEGSSRGYQIARPKASMLKAYGGRTQLYPFDAIANNTDPTVFNQKLTNNPYIPDYNSGLSKLKGTKYGTADEVKALFERYEAMDADVSDTSVFDNVNWFCAEEKTIIELDPCILNPDLCPPVEEKDPCEENPDLCPPEENDPCEEDPSLCPPDPPDPCEEDPSLCPPDPCEEDPDLCPPDPDPCEQNPMLCPDPPDPCDINPIACDDPDPNDPDPTPVLTSYARGRSIVKSGVLNYQQTSWDTSGETLRISISMEEGETQDVQFFHRVLAKGNLPQMVGYKVSDSTETTLAESFIDYNGHSIDDSVEVYSDTITVDQAGSYCQTLQVTYERPAPAGTQNRYSTVCVDVTVTRTLPDIEMHGRMEITVGDQTLSTDWDAGLDNPVIIDVNLQEGETVDVYINEYMKAIDGVDTEFPFDIVNSYYIGRTSRGYYKYKADTDSNIDREVASNSVEGIGKRMTVCETMYYVSEGENKAVQACVRVGLTKNPRQLGQPGSKTAYIDFSAQINPYISIRVGSNGLITSGGINQLLRSGTDVRITTNNMTGYTAVITSNIRSSDTNATSLYNRYSKNYLPTLVSPVEKSSFPVNRWGFSFDDTEEGDDSSVYRNLEPLDAATPYVFSESDHADEKEHDVYFAAMSDINQASGTYSAGVSLRATAGIVPNLYNSIDEIQYMQDINDNIIDSMVLNQQYQLFDQRDNKTYYVAKLPDGNVWMTQNLDFELKEGDRLFEGDSDVSHRSDGAGSYLDIPRSTSGDFFEPWGEPNGAVRYYGDTTYRAAIKLSGGHSYRPESNYDPETLTGLYSASFSVKMDDGSIQSRVNATIPRFMMYGYGASSAPAINYCMGSAWTEEMCRHWSVGIYYSPEIAHGEAFESSNGQTEVNTICPGRWTLPTHKEFETLVSGKKASDLHAAPYYLLSAGLYGLRNEPSDYSQWLTPGSYSGYITYLNKDGNTISSYPAGLSNENVFGNFIFTSDSSKRANSTDFESLGASVRCIARRGY